MDLGFSELILILLVAFLLYGSKLPQIARALGHSVREFKKVLQDMTEDVSDSSLTAKEIQDSWTSFGPEESKQLLLGSDKEPSVGLVENGKQQAAGNDHGNGGQRTEGKSNE